MYLDLSRVRFDAAKHYSAVLLQQGRVVLDSDMAEQNAIMQHYLRTAIADIVGPAACPALAPGFDITATSTDNQADLAVSAGRIYVDGILAETGPGSATYLTQPDGYLDPDRDGLPADGAYLVYLRVWERSVTMVQDPDIREVALGIHGPDTTGRAQVVWQVAVWPAAGDASPEGTQKDWQSWRSRLYKPAGTLRARATQPDDTGIDICSISPQAQYRGRENQLYRVEVLCAGVAASRPERRPPGRTRWLSTCGRARTARWCSPSGRSPAPRSRSRHSAAICRRGSRSATGSRSSMTPPPAGSRTTYQPSRLVRYSR